MKRHLAHPGHQRYADGAGPALCGGAPRPVEYDHTDARAWCEFMRQDDDAAGPWCATCLARLRMIIWREEQLAAHSRPAGA